MTALPNVMRTTRGPYYILLLLTESEVITRKSQTSALMAEIFL